MKKIVKFHAGAVLVVISGLLLNRSMPVRIKSKRFSDGTRRIRFSLRVDEALAAQFLRDLENLEAASRADYLTPEDVAERQGAEPMYSA